jgi:hypothetical protein
MFEETKQVIELKEKCKNDFLRIFGTSLNNSLGFDIVMFDKFINLNPANL